MLHAWACRLGLPRPHGGKDLSAGVHARPVSPIRGGGHGARVRPGAGRKGENPVLFYLTGRVAPAAGIRVSAPGPASESEAGPGR